LIETKARPERVILIGLELTAGGSRGGDGVRANLPRVTVEESMKELVTLARSAGADIVDQAIQHRPKPDAATLIGSGKVEEIHQLAKLRDADLAIVDYELSPTQQRNLEKALDLRVIDRTQLILDIFAARARTREGQLQVELAQLNYLLPRLTGRGIEMSRHARSR
jgi:GTPase